MDIFLYPGLTFFHSLFVYHQVLPHLMYKQNDCFFRELARMWHNYCIMIRSVVGFFSYLDRCYLEQCKLPSLRDTAATSFFDPVSTVQGNVLLPHLLLLLNITAYPLSVYNFVYPLPIYQVFSYFNDEARTALLTLVILRQLYFVLFLNAFLPSYDHNIQVDPRSNKNVMEVWWIQAFGMLCMAYVVLKSNP